MHSAKFKFEINRKLFHLCSLILPISYIFMSRIIMAVILMSVTALIFYIDISRHYNQKIKGVVNKFFSQIMRDSEISGSFRLSGMTYLFLGCFLVVLLFPKGLAITSMLVLIVSDTFASLVGMQFGVQTKIGKSLAGSAAFLASTIMVSLLSYFTISYSTTFKVIIISSLITTFVEFYSQIFKIDDNLAIPLTYAFSTVFFSFIL